LAFLRPRHKKGSPNGYNSLGAITKSFRESSTALEFFEIAKTLKCKSIRNE